MAIPKYKYDIFLSFQQSLLQKTKNDTKDTDKKVDDEKDNLGATAARAIYNELKKEGYKVYFSIGKKNDADANNQWEPALEQSRMAVVVIADQFYRCCATKTFATELNKILTNYKKGIPTLLINLNKLFNSEKVKTNDDDYSDKTIAQTARLLKEVTQTDQETYLKYEVLREDRDRDYKGDIKAIKKLIKENLKSSKRGRSWQRRLWPIRKYWLGVFAIFLACAIAGLLYIHYSGISEEEEKPLVFAGGATVVNFVKEKYNIDVKRYHAKSLYIHLPSGNAESFLLEDACTNPDSSSYYYPVVLSSECFADSGFIKKAGEMKDSRAIVEIEIGSAKLVVFTNDTNLTKDSTITVDDLNKRMGSMDPDNIYQTSDNSGTYIKYRENGIEPKGSNIINEKLNGRRNTIIALGNDFYPTKEEGVDTTFHRLFVVKDDDTITMPLFIYTVAHKNGDGQATLGRPVRDLVRKIDSRIAYKVWSMSKSEAVIKKERLLRSSSTANKTTPVQSK